MTTDRIRPEIERALTLLDEGDVAAAVELLRGVVARSDLDPGDEAGVRYALGTALGEAGDREGMTRERLAVLRLDARVDRSEPLLSRDEFENIAEQALAELPGELLERLRNVAVLVAERPSPEMVAGGIDPRVLGLFHGVPMGSKSVSFGSPYADTIHLFRANLERISTTRDGLAERIRVTVWHETAHYFGYSEEQLRRMGLG